ncbi:MAG TPA: tetratricopeptide repeat protein [Rhizomicrobium sp.]|nr:tetratricopeptide repeat protein [Rhizomicrobium sp.]
MKRTSAAAAIAAAALLACTVAARADDSFRGATVPASLPPGESQRTIDEFRARAVQPEVAGLFYLFHCMTDTASRKSAQAVRDCGAAIAYDPDNADAYKFRGEAYLFLGRYELALQDFDRSLVLDPRDAEAFAGRGETFRMLREFPKAIAAFGKAIALAPADPHYWNARCWIRAEAKVELASARADCTAALRLDPAFALALDSRGFVYLRMGRYARAIRDYDRAIGLRPDYPTALFGRGIAKLRLGRIAAGRADIAKARAIDPDVDAFFVRMGITDGERVKPPRNKDRMRDDPKAGPGDRFARR